ncbi:hypothetical protein L596_009425 [Steinernema carpocapsae]|uniref:Uncharacterized protein n=1 Tax=Steinernema carpocapsae TaxID=34508 RepID=A0A4U5PFH9_STECR|nr:hypothetical protein L596_009425 [Steinernema carpocapsae]
MKNKLTLLGESTDTAPSEIYGITWPGRWTIAQLNAARIDKTQVPAAGIQYSLKSNNAFVSNVPLASSTIRRLKSIALIDQVIGVLFLGLETLFRTLNDNCEPDGRLDDVDERALPHGHLKSDFPKEFLRV